MIAIASMPIEKGGGHEAGRALLAQLYRAHTGQELPEIALGARGKPYFPGSVWHFSISHTPRHAFCALSDRPIGIDAEEADRQIPLKLAGRILSPPEMLRYEAAADKRDALLRLWVLKEATVKCSGEGLRGCPNHTDLSPDDPRIRLMDGCYVAVVE